MIAQVSKFGVLAVLALALNAGQAEAHYPPSGCYPVHHHCWYPVHHHHCWYPIHHHCWYPIHHHHHCCHPCHSHCGVYRVSEPSVPLGGPFPVLLRGAKVGNGVIVQFTVPTGTAAQPTDEFNVVQTGGGEFEYIGYNKKLDHPGLPGGSTRYQIFLCPRKVGECSLDVQVKLTDGTTQSAKYGFKIDP
jgi:hypothetical protein